MAAGQSIPQPVYSSLSHQTIDINIIPCVIPGIINSNKNTDPIKIKCECNSRNMAVSLVKDYFNSTKYVAMQDRDFIHLDDTNYARCINFLDLNPCINAVSLPWKEYEIKDHIRLTGTVFRTEVFKNILFKGPHICKSLKDNLGDSYIFLPSDIRLIKEIKC